MTERPQAAPTSIPTLRRLPETGRREIARQDAIAALMADFSIEVTPGGAARIADFRDHLAPGTRVAVTFLPGGDWRDTAATAERLAREEMRPVPHIVARSIAGRAELEAYIARISAVTPEAVVLAGAVDRPSGPFASSMDVLETGFLSRHGIDRIGAAGHPEGSPDIPHDALWQALRWKRDYAARTGGRVYICTQFVFEASAIIAFDRELRAQGIDLPLRVGLPGLATLKTLINHARACGVGASMKFLTRQARSVSKMMTVNAPDRLLDDLAVYLRQTDDTRIAGVHVYPLGGLAKSADWSRAVADGRITLNDHGFSVRD